MTNNVNYTIACYISFNRKYSTVPTFEQDTTIGIANKQNTNGLPVLLKKVSNFNLELDIYTPKEMLGTITIDDKYDGIAFNRKFSDIFDEYTPIKGNCIVRVYANPVNDGELTTEIFAYYCKVESYSIDLDKQEVNLRVSSYTLPKQQFTREVKADDSFSFGAFDLYIPQTSIGKNIPLMLGENIYSKLVPMTDREIAFSPNGITGASQSVGYAMAVNFGAFYTSNPTNFYIKQNGEYKEFATTSTVSTAVYDKTGLTLTTDLTLNENIEKATYIATSSDSSNRYIITGGEIQLRGLSTYSGTVGGTVSINLYEEDPTAITKAAGKAPKKDPIARATIDKSDYAAQFKPGVSADFYLSFSFDKPVLAGDPSTMFYLGISHADNGSNTMTVKQGIDSSFNRFTRVPGGDWETGSSTNAFITKFYPLGKADWSGTTDVDSNGLQYKLIQIAQKSAGTGAVNPDITNLDIMVKGDGLKDDGSGTITGSASSLIKYAHHQIKLLHYYWDSATWVAGNFSISNYNHTHSNINNSANYYFRKTSFTTVGRQLASSIILEICRNAEIRLAVPITSSGTAGVWAYGSTETGTPLLTDDEIKGLSYYVADTKSVVNVVRMNYSPNALNKEISNYLFNGNDGGFTRDYTVVISASSRSRVNFGQKTLANQDYPMINEDGSAYRVAQIILEQNALPPEMITFELPIWEMERYSSTDFNPLGVIRIQSPRLPNYYGSHVDPQLAYYNGVEGDIIAGSEVMAKIYRAQIEGVRFNFDGTKYPYAVLLARLIINEDEVT